MLRQYFFQGTDLSRHSIGELDGVANALNTRPQKALGWKTPQKSTTSSWSPSMKQVLRRPFESAQYVSIMYPERLAEAGIAPSDGSADDSYDNALAETINGLSKDEVIHRRAPGRSFEAVEYATLETKFSAANGSTGSTTAAY